MEDMKPESLFGNKTVTAILLYLHKNEQVHATGLSRLLKIPLNMVQKQLKRLERGGVFVCRSFGKLKIYSWNYDLPWHRELRSLLKVYRLRQRRSADLEQPDAADNLHLPLAVRFRLAENLSSTAQLLSPYPRYRPFVKSFGSRREYESWRKKQKHPLLF